MTHCKWFVVILGIITVRSIMVLTAHAGTPDGQTPAVESVCDPLKADGVTHGLYGLCIAFCEAQDWESCGITPETCGKSAAKILSRYEALRSPADPDMPCIVHASECPCWNGSATAFPGGVNLAEVWIANAPRNCTQGDECQDTLLPDGPNSGAFCQADFNFPMESFGTAVLGSFPPVKICQASKFFENIGVQSVFLLIDDATFTRCLAEHDAFTVGGTFPSYSNRFSCGLPTPTP